MELSGVAWVSYWSIQDLFERWKSATKFKRVWGVGIMFKVWKSKFYSEDRVHCLLLNKAMIPCHLSSLSSFLF